MSALALKSQSIVPRMDGILADMERLRAFTTLTAEEFITDPDKFDIAKARLREALEGVFHIGAHILSRLDGGRVTEYKEIARKLGTHGIVEKQFADTTLVRMAGYRNRLTHFYAEITPEELHHLLAHQLDDFETFLTSIKNLLAHPERLGFTVE